MAEGTTIVIQIDRLLYKYKKHDENGAVTYGDTVLENVSLDIAEGEFIAVLGKNGSGKSTLAKHINAILTPSSGTVFVDGLDSRDNGNIYNIRKKAGMVFQNPDNQMVASVVEEETAFGPENLCLSTEEIRKRVDMSLEAVGMSRDKSRVIKTLSGGQKQRLAIAGILAMGSDYLILDEPTAMLDPEARCEVFCTIKKLNREKKITVVLITHSMDEALQADRIIVMDAGRVIADGTPDNIFSDMEIIKRAGLIPPYEQRIRMAAEEYLKRGVSCEAAYDRCTKGEAVIDLQDVGYTYNAGTVYEKKALSNINLTLYRGEIAGLAGRTGSGKSTLIQLLNGLEAPTEGRVLYKGSDIHAGKISMKELRSRVGLVFQYPQYQIIKTTVYEDVMFGPANMGLDRAECEIRCRNALNSVGIAPDRWNSDIMSLSGGQIRRVAIAGVLAMQPDYIILDEPAAGLDIYGKIYIFDKLKEMCREYNIGVLIISHSMEDIAEYADRMLVLDDGKMMYDDAPEKVFAHRKELKRAGLDIPETMKLMDKLRNRGFYTDKNIIRESEASVLVADWLKRGGSL